MSGWLRRIAKIASSPAYYRGGKESRDVDSRSALRDREKSELVDFRCVAYLKRLVPYYLTSSLNT